MTESWHGTAGGYTNHACRCNRCADAMSDLLYASRQRRAAERVLVAGRLTHPDAKHGTYSGYIHYSCRCIECTAANNRTNRRVAANAAARLNAPTTGDHHA